MAKLCPKGKAAAKRKFKVYPSAYANMYASGVCSGKITPGGKREKKVDGGEVGNKDITKPKPRKFEIKGVPKGAPESVKNQIRKANSQVRKYNKMGIENFEDIKKAKDDGRLSRTPRRKKFKASGGRINMKSGGLAKRGKGCEIR